MPGFPSLSVTWSPWKLKDGKDRPIYRLVGRCYMFMDKSLAWVSEIADDDWILELEKRVALHGLCVTTCLQDDGLTAVLITALDAHDFVSPRSSGFVTNFNVADRMCLWPWRQVTPLLLERLRNFSCCTCAKVKGPSGRSRVCMSPSASGAARLGCEGAPTCWSPCPLHTHVIFTDVALALDPATQWFVEQQYGCKGLTSGSLEFSTAEFRGFFTRWSGLRAAFAACVWYAGTVAYTLDSASGEHLWRP